MDVIEENKLKTSPGDQQQNTVSASRPTEPKSVSTVLDSATRDATVEFTEFLETAELMSSANLSSATVMI